MHSRSGDSVIRELKVPPETNSNFAYYYHNYYDNY
jgi:hypothetical protein